MRTRTKEEWDRVYVQNVKDEKRLRERIQEYKEDLDFLELEYENIQEEGARIDRITGEYEKAKVEFKKSPKVDDFELEDNEDFIAEKEFNSDNYPELL